MKKINLSVYTEQMLKKKLQELKRFIPYDVYVHIEQIINKAINQHFIFKSQIEEMLMLLQECEQHENEENVYIAKKQTIKNELNTVESNDNNRIIFHNQMHNFEVMQFRKILMLMIVSKIDTDEKTKTNGIIF